MSSPSTPEQAERRSIVVAGAGIFGALVLLVIIAIVFSGGAGDPHPATASTAACSPGDEACLAARQSAERPGIIPHPGEGQAPTQPGDRGGWEQLAVLGLIVVALATIATVIVRSARRTRRTPRGPTSTPRDDGAAVAPPP